MQRRRGPPGFEELFAAAKRRVRTMDFRVVKIKDDATTSTIFEVYASIALGTEGEFNLFETHQLLPPEGPGTLTLIEPLLWATNRCTLTS